MMMNLAMIGDIPSLEYFLQDLENQYPTIQCNSITVEALVKGYVNVFDFHKAISTIQRMYRQYHIKPRCNAHYHLLEMMLGSAKQDHDLFDAKQYVLFLKELWKEDNFIHLFRYYGHDLRYDDFH